MVPEPIIRAVNLHKSFGTHHVLRGLSLDFAPSTTTVILGGSGNGKSVFMKHLVGLLRPDEGQVLIEGEDLWQASKSALKHIRQKFGMVFQMAALFDSLTVFDNVVFPLREHRPKLKAKEHEELVMNRLEALGLADSRDKYPAELSGGMRKRVGLARAVILDPKVVLYDEPTTGLDPLTTKNVDEMIMAAKEKFGVTNIVISHDINSSFRIADQIAFLDQGQIIEHGPVEAFRNTSNTTIQNFMSLSSNQH